jgi:YggT family protein
MATSYDRPVGAYSFVTGPEASAAALAPAALPDVPLANLTMPDAASLALLRQLLPPLHLVLALLLAAWTLLFLFRIVLTWYPQVDLSQGVMRLVALPTEPLLAPTRRLIAPIGGVDVTPVIWVGLISLAREILVGQQGLITQVMQRVSVLPA